MTTVHAGATLDRLPGPKYLAALGFSELELRPPLPRVATVSKWREGLAGPVSLSLLAPPPCVTGPAGPLRLDAPLSDAIEWMADTAAALDAAFVVARTPPTVSPGSRSRDRLASYFDRVRRELATRRLVWEPSGPWEVDEAQAFAAEHGVLVALDPIETEPSPSPVAYCRLAAMGNRPRLGEGVLETLLDRLEALGTEEAWVALRSERSFQEATRLQQLAESR